MIDALFEQVEPMVGTKRACAAVGRPRASHYRNLAPARVSVSKPRPTPANALSLAEREEVLELLNSVRFANCSAAQVWAVTLDEGKYLCSISTMYRVLRRAGQSRERRRQATHPPRVRPELVAYKPNQVWSWDISNLKSINRGEYFKLYVVLDIFSRYVVGWCVSRQESKELAKELIAGAVATQQIEPGTLNIHADRGSSMTSGTVAELLGFLGISRTHSRPHVCNDNPYSEAAFKTLKYCPAFPEHFGSIEDARNFCAAFFAHYNHEHRHSGIGLHTPASVHFGTALEVREARAKVLDAAYAANPLRFGNRKPEPPRLPDVAWINTPVKEVTQND
ncbi:MAG: IS3 family transposase [Actinomycetota bacterium]